MLHDAKQNITSVDAITQRISAEDAAGSVDFFKTSVPQAFSAVKDLKLQSQLESANAAAMKAMIAYAAWIKTLKPTRHVRDRRGCLQEELQYEDGLDTCRSTNISGTATSRTRAAARAVRRNGEDHQSESDAAAGLSFDHAKCTRAPERAARQSHAAISSSCARSSRPSTSSRCRRTRTSRSSRRRRSSDRRPRRVRRFARPARDRCDAIVLQRDAGRPERGSPHRKKSSSRSSTTSSFRSFRRTKSIRDTSPTLRSIAT